MLEFNILNDIVYSDVYTISDGIQMRNLTFKDIKDFGIDNFFDLVTLITTNPDEQKVMLDKFGIDYTKVNDFDFFRLFIFPQITQEQWDILFVDFKADMFVERTIEGRLCLFKPQLFMNDIEITFDESVYFKMVEYLCLYHNLNKPKRTDPANEYARKYFIERARKEMERNKNKKRTNRGSFLFDCMMSLVLFSSFTFESLSDSKMFIIYNAIQRIDKKINYELVMSGVYHGTIDGSKIDHEKISWLTNK